MRLVRQTTSLLLAAVIFLAPLLCVRFCQLQMLTAISTSASGATESMPMPMSMADMAMHHAVLHHSEDAPNGKHANSSHAPLNELKQMMSAVTEFIVTVSLVIALIVVATVSVARHPLLRTVSFDVITPPPRRFA